MARAFHRTLRSCAALDDRTLRAELFGVFVGESEAPSGWSEMKQRHFATTAPQAAGFEYTGQGPCPGRICSWFEQRSVKVRTPHQPVRLVQHRVYCGFQGVEQVFPLVRSSNLLSADCTAVPLPTDELSPPGNVQYTVGRVPPAYVGGRGYGLHGGLRPVRRVTFTSRPMSLRRFRSCQACSSSTGPVHDGPRPLLRTCSGPAPVGPLYRQPSSVRQTWMVSKPPSAE